MNPKLQFEYEQVNVPEGSWTVCKIGIKESLFTTLGLNEGQTELKPEQFAWFELHGDTVVEVLERFAKQNHMKDLESYQAAIKASHKLLDKFCRDCKIKDT